MRSSVMVIMAMVLTMVARPALAGTVEVPAGTAVPLQLVAPVEASTIQKDATIRLTVATDVLAGRTQALREQSCFIPLLDLPLGCWSAAAT
jgi:hypothetical protein